MKAPRPSSAGAFALLAVCVAAALVTRRFVYVAWYPVAVGAAWAAAFGLSLFTAKPLALAFAERFAHGLLPEGAERYCRRATAYWCAVLTANALVAAATVFAPRCAWVAWNCAASYGFLGLAAWAESRVRRRRFAVHFETSGSTGTPKPIVKPFETLAREVLFHRERLSAPLAARPLFLATVEAHHLYGALWRTLLPRAAGCALAPETILAPETLLAKMRAAPAVFLVTTPSFLSRFLAYAGQYDVPRNAVEIVTSGALLTPAVSAATARVFGRAPLEIFGSTETGGVAWRRQSESPLWTLFPCVKARADAEGRLVVRSPFSCTRRAFRMGDAVRFAAGDGRRFELLGRRDRLAKIAERRVDLPALETEMAALDGVDEAALVVLDGARGPFLGAVVACAQTPADAHAAARDLRRRLLPVFPAGTVPRKYRFVRELPRNAQGKVRQDALRALFAAPGFAPPPVSNESETETTWCADVVFRAEDGWFDGHFPTFPILPGVATFGCICTWAEAQMRRRGSAALHLVCVKKLKFTKPVLPDAPVRVALAWRMAGATASCDWSIVRVADAVPCARGTLVYETEAAS